MEVLSNIQRKPSWTKKGSTWRSQISLSATHDFKQQQQDILLNTKEQSMKESNILVGNATIKQRQKEILLNTKGQYMKESNTLAGNATIKQQEK